MIIQPLVEVYIFLFVYIRSNMCTITLSVATVVLEVSGRNSYREITFLHISTLYLVKT